MSHIAIFTKRDEVVKKVAESLAPLFLVMAADRLDRLQEILPAASLVILDDLSLTDEERRKWRPPAIPILYIVSSSEHGESQSDSHLLETDSPATLRRIVLTHLEQQRLHRELTEAKQMLTREMARHEEKDKMFKKWMLDWVDNRYIPYRDALKSFSRLLSARRDMDAFLSAFLEGLRDYLGVSRLAIYVDPLGGGQFVFKSAVGIPRETAEAVTLTRHKGIGAFLFQKGVILRAASARFSVSENLEAHRELETLKCEFAAPMLAEGKLLAIVVGNEKVSGLSLSDEEVEFLFFVCSQIAMALQNVLLAEALAGQKVCLEQILSSIASGVIAADHQGRITAFNQKAREILRLKKEEWVGRFVSELPAPLGDLLLKTLEAAIPYWRQEIQLSESGISLGLNTALVQGAPGENKGAVMIFADLGPVQKQWQKARHEEEIAFVRKVAMRSSHELKNCLVSIRTFTQLLPDKYADKEFRTDFYTIVNHEVDRLTVLVENLNFFAMPLDIQVQPENLTRLIEEALESIPGDERRNIVVEKELHLPKEEMLLDRDSIKTVFFHLFRNAIQAMPKGGKLRVQSAELGDMARKTQGGEKVFAQILVTDTGVGMTKEECQQAFDPFFTLKSRGMGLGLTIVKKIVEAHGGEIKLESKLGQGTTVEILIPRRAATPAPTPEKVQEQDDAAQKSLNR